MITEYTTEDDMQTLRLWYDAKPFTKELETEIRAIPTTAFSDDTIEYYIQERLKENNGEYDKPNDDDTKVDDTKLEETKESVQDEKEEIQEVGEVIEADACYWDGWNP